MAQVGEFGHGSILHAFLIDSDGLRGNTGQKGIKGDRGPTGLPGREGLIVSDRFD